MSTKDTRSKITVREARVYDIAADRADLSVTVEGASLFTGQEALKQAREVAQLAADLQAAGLPPEAIFLQGVSAEVQNGTLSKTSRAKYRLRVHCADISKLADVIGVITSQKSTALNSIMWGYPESSALHDDWLLACIGRANEKAKKIAAALGVQLVGIHSFSESFVDPEAGDRLSLTLSDAPSGMRRSRMTSEDLGVEISHTKSVTVSVSVDYLLSDYAATV